MERELSPELVARLCTLAAPAKPSNNPVGGKKNGVRAGGQLLGENESGVAEERWCDEWIEFCEQRASNEQWTTVLHLFCPQVLAEGRFVLRKAAAVPDVAPIRRFCSFYLEPCEPFCKCRGSCGLDTLIEESSGATCSARHADDILNATRENKHRNDLSSAFEHCTSVSREDLTLLCSTVVRHDAMKNFETVLDLGARAYPLVVVTLRSVLSNSNESFGPHGLLAPVHFEHEDKDEKNKPLIFDAASVSVDDFSPASRSLRNILSRFSENVGSQNSCAASFSDEGDVPHFLTDGSDDCEEEHVGENELFLRPELLVARDPGSKNNGAQNAGIAKAENDCLFGDEVVSKGRKRSSPSSLYLSALASEAHFESNGAEQSVGDGIENISHGANKKGLFSKASIDCLRPDENLPRKNASDFSYKQSSSGGCGGGGGSGGSGSGGGSGGNNSDGKEIAKHGGKNGKSFCCGTVLAIHFNDTAMHNSLLLDRDDPARKLLFDAFSKFITVLKSTSLDGFIRNTPGLLALKPKIPPLGIFEGLRLSLYDFQRRAVHWMMERECGVYETQRAFRKETFHMGSQCFQRLGFDIKTTHQSFMLQCFNKERLDELRNDGSRAAGTTVPVHCGVLAAGTGTGKTITAITFSFLQTMFDRRRRCWREQTPAQPRNESADPDETMKVLQMVPSPVFASAEQQAETRRKRPLFANCTLVVAPRQVVQQWMAEVRKTLTPVALDAYRVRVVSRHADLVALGAATIATDTDMLIVNRSLFLSKVYRTYSVIDNRNSMGMLLYNSGFNLEGEFQRFVDGMTLKSARECRGAGLLHAFHWRRLIVDEMHELDHRCTVVERAIIGLSADFRWGLTATPNLNSATAFSDAANVGYPALLQFDSRKLRIGATKECISANECIFWRRFAATNASFGSGDGLQLPKLFVHRVDVRQTPIEAALYGAIDVRNVRRRLFFCCHHALDDQQWSELRTRALRVGGGGGGGGGGGVGDEANLFDPKCALSPADVANVLQRERRQKLEAAAEMLGVLVERARQVWEGDESIRAYVDCYGQCFSSAHQRGALGKGQQDDNFNDELQHSSKRFICSATGRKVASVLSGEQTQKTQPLLEFYYRHYLGHYLAENGLNNGSDLTADGEFPNSDGTSNSNDESTRKNKRGEGEKRKAHDQNNDDDNENEEKEEEELRHPFPHRACAQLTNLELEIREISGPAEAVLREYQFFTSVLARLTSAASLVAPKRGATGDKEHETRQEGEQRTENSENGVESGDCGGSNAIGGNGTGDNLCPICLEPYTQESCIALSVCGHEMCGECANVCFNPPAAPSVPFASASLAAAAGASAQPYRWSSGRHRPGQPRSSTKKHLVACPQCRTVLKIPDDVRLVRCCVPPPNSGCPSGAEENVLLTERNPADHDTHNGSSASAEAGALHGETSAKNSSGASVGGAPNSGNVDSYGTKISALLALIGSIRERSDGRKIIIYAQFDHLLRLVSDALRSFGIEHLQVHGSAAQCSAAIKRFTSDRGIDILLLSSESTISGINLVIAKHLIAVHPPLDSSVEQAVARHWQAIGRIRRISNMDDCHVHNLVTVGTIESDLYEQQLEYAKKAFSGDSGIVWNP